MQTSAKVTKALIVLGLVVLSTACGNVDEAPVLEAMQGPMLELAKEVKRIDDIALTRDFRDTAAIWQAGVGRRDNFGIGIKGAFEDVFFSAVH